jgi:hypothetical protein
VFAAERGAWHEAGFEDRHRDLVADASLQLVA